VELSASILSGQGILLREVSRGFSLDHEGAGASKDSDLRDSVLPSSRPKHVLWIQERESKADVGGRDGVTEQVSHEDAYHFLRAKLEDQDLSPVVLLPVEGVDLATRRTREEQTEAAGRGERLRRRKTPIGREGDVPVRDRNLHPNAWVWPRSQEDAVLLQRLACRTELAPRSVSGTAEEEPGGLHQLPRNRGGGQVRQFGVPCRLHTETLDRATVVRRKDDGSDDEQQNAAQDRDRFSQQPVPECRFRPWEA